ncbi:MAG: hypothetical protein RL011_1856 [Pseudomonadota bacterium]
MKQIKMEQILTTVGFMLALGLSHSVMAGPGDGCHFHGSKPVAEAVVLKCADLRKETLVKSGKLEGSWANVKHESISMIDGKKGKEWRVVYKNATATSSTKASLYMFFTPAGNFIAANHSGQ